MKKSLFPLLCLLLAAGCVAHRSASGSFDGLSAAYSGDARILAERTVEELSRRHAPAHTAVALDRAPGVFGDVLEQKLRADGFALASSGLGVSYKLDVLDADGAPTLGFVQVACSDGQMFSITREVFKGTEPPPPASEPEERPLESRFLPESAPLPMQAPAASGSGTPQAFGVIPPNTVHTKGRASRIAKRNGVPVADFCRWNGVSPDETLYAGHRVWLHEPPVAAAAPVTPPPAARPVAAAAAMTSPRAPAAAPIASAPAAVPVSSAVTPVAAKVPAPAPEPAASSPEPVAPIAETPVEQPVWELQKGTMLRGQVEGWAAVAGYSLIWNAQNDYELRSSATFSGEFVDAVRSFFAALQANGLALRVTIYQGNRVMEVSEH